MGADAGESWIARTPVAWRLNVSEAIRKEAACFQGATVTALRGRALAVAKPRPRKAVTVAPKTQFTNQLRPFRVLGQPLTSDRAGSEHFVTDSAEGRPLSLATPAVPETLRARPRRWLSRLWVRVSLVLILIFAISLFAWWLPRRTMVSVWWNGGVVTCDKAHERTSLVLLLLNPTGAGWSSGTYETLNRLFVWTCTDTDITVVYLHNSKITGDWLFRLKRFPKLTAVGLHDRQIGTELDHLRGCLALRSVCVKSASDRHLVELQRSPQFDSLGLWEPQAGDIGLESLTALSKLDSLLISDCQCTDEVLEALPELPFLESLTLRDCTGFVDDDLQYLHRLPNLKSLDLMCSTSSLGDVALEHLSQLNRLEMLELRTPWKDVTDEGLAKLAGMKSLKQMYVLGHQCSPSQLQRLRKALPNCAITVN